MRKIREIARLRFSLGQSGRAIARACNISPATVQDYLGRLAQHYGFAVIPARPRKPRDRAKVEQGVLLAERWIIAALRKHRFSDLFDVNDAIAPLVTRLNERPMRKIGRSRRQVFEAIERATLRALPDSPYVLATFARATINIDYHVEFEKHYYSVPYKLRAQTERQVELRATAMTVEVYSARRDSRLRVSIEGSPSALVRSTLSPCKDASRRLALLGHTASEIMSANKSCKDASVGLALLEQRTETEHDPLAAA